LDIGMALSPFCTKSITHFLTHFIFMALTY
jgi:hypothetical protein